MTMTMATALMMTTLMMATTTRDDGYIGDGDAVRTDGNACTPAFWYIIAVIRRAGTVAASLCND